MKRLKGPELRMPDLKVPTLLADLFYDLRDRRLLPLVGLVLAAIVAVPFLLGDSKEEVVPMPSSGLSAKASQVAEASRLTVVEAKPGLRDYHKRLHDRTPTDPFKQHYTGAAGGQLNPEGSSTSKTTETSTAATTDSQGAAGGSPSSDDGALKPGELILFSFAINVRITRSGGKDAEAGQGGQGSEPIVKKRVLPQTPLPGEKAPVVTYLGASKKMTSLDRPKVLLLVSPDVKSVFGDAHCVSGTEICQLLEVEPGFPEVFVYGDNEVRYTINILKAGLVVTNRSKG